MSRDELRDRTSSSIGEQDAPPDAGLFDETISAYSQRRKTAQEFLVGALAESHRDAFRLYFTKPRWDAAGDDSSPGR